VHGEQASQSASQYCIAFAIEGPAADCGSELVNVVVAIADQAPILHSGRRSVLTSSPAVPRSPNRAGKHRNQRADGLFCGSRR